MSWKKLENWYGTKSIRHQKMKKLKQNKPKISEAKLEKGFCTAYKQKGITTMLIKGFYIKTLSLLTSM